MPNSAIPDDVMKAAREVCQSIYATIPDHPEENIARAIMAERERCARIADEENAAALMNYDTAGDYFGGYGAAAFGIAQTIRKGEA